MRLMGISKSSEDAQRHFFDWVASSWYLFFFFFIVAFLRFRCNICFQAVRCENPLLYTLVSYHSVYWQYTQLWLFVLEFHVVIFWPGLRLKFMLRISIALAVSPTVIWSGTISNLNFSIETLPETRERFCKKIYPEGRLFFPTEQVDEWTYLLVPLHPHVRRIWTDASKAARESLVISLVSKSHLLRKASAGQLWSFALEIPSLLRCQGVAYLQGWDTSCVVHQQWPSCKCSTSVPEIVMR